MLRTRLFLNLLPFVVTLLAIGAYAIALLSRLAGNVDTTVTENYRGIITAQALRLSLAGMDREVWIALSSTNGSVGNVAGHQKRFEENLALLAKTISLPG